MLTTHALISMNEFAQGARFRALLRVLQLRFGVRCVLANFELRDMEFALAPLLNGRLQQGLISLLVR
jgi:hypothetical protein